SPRSNAGSSRKSAQISSTQELSERHEGKLCLWSGAVRNRSTGWADWTLPLPYVQEVPRRRLRLDRLGQSRSFQVAQRSRASRRLKRRRANGAISVPFAGRIRSRNAKASHS